MKAFKLLVAFILGAFIMMMIDYRSTPKTFRDGWYKGAYTVAEDLVRNGEVTPMRQAQLFYIDSLEYYGAFK